MTPGRKKGTKLTPAQIKAATKTRALNKLAKEKAKETGELPHEWLLRISRGDCITQRRLVITYHKTGPNKGEEKERRWIEEDFYPGFDVRMDAAKAAAPFYAPRLATQTMQIGKETTEAVIQALADLAANLPV